MCVTQEKVQGDSQVEDNRNNVEPYKVQINWKVCSTFIFLHLGAIYGFYLIFTSAKVFTTIFALLLYELGMIGTTAGAHRLWSHKAYKATWQLKAILLTLQTLAFQYSVIIWSRDHRLHHKYSETDADPHNAKRGLFFSHIGCQFCRKHPEVRRKGQEIDISDLYGDPLVRFQHNHFFVLVTLISVIIPLVIPMVVWNESFSNTFFVGVIWRYVFTLNATWLVNSIGHYWGYRPYDKTIQPAQNKFVSLLTSGEGWHNYHHAFPWDYRGHEVTSFFNPTTTIIDFFAKIGWAYDLKAVPSELVKRRVLKSGDGSHFEWNLSSNKEID